MSERKRASGFVLMDAAFAADAKFRKMERQAANPHDFAAAVGVFWLLLGDARRGKSPVIDWDDYDDWDTEIAQLQNVHLLNAEGFDPEVFDRWAPAYRAPGENPRSDRTLSYPSVPFGNGTTNTSGHIRSTQNGVGGVGEGVAKPQAFMRWGPKGPDDPTHWGQHPGCLVCEPLKEGKP